MKVRIGCSVKDYLSGKGDNVLASWSVEQFGFTVGNAYEIKGVSPTRNLIIENNYGETKEYAPVHFSPCI